MHHLSRKLLSNIILFSLFIFQHELAYSRPADTQNLPVIQVQDRTIVVGSEQAFPPFSTGLTDQTAGGFTVELWKAVAAEVGLDYTIRVLPFHEIVQEFKKGKIDVLINFAQSDDRKEIADFTVPHVVVHGAIFVHKGDKGIQSEKDLVGKSIIVLNADLAHDYAVSKGWGKQLVLVSTVEKGLRLLASGKHDAMLLTKLTGLQTLQAIGLTNIDVLKINVGFSQKFSFAVQKGQSDLLSMLNEGMALTKSNGSYNKIYEKWFGVYEVKETRLYDVLPYFIPPICLLLGLSGYFYHTRKVERKQALDEMKIAAIAFETQEGIMVMDANAVIVRVNKAFKKITGFDAEQAIGQTMSLLNSGRQSEAFDVAMWDSIRRSGFWEGEVWSRRKNGEIYPKKLTLTAVKTTRGDVINYVGIFTDNTEHKKIEELRLIDESKYRSALVREVHHRIKNNLQGVVLLISNMTMSYPELTEPMEKVMTKVNSIATVHGLQGNHSKSAVIVVDLVKAIVDSNQTLFNARISVHFPDNILMVYLSENESVPIALILNELLLNEIKHSENSNKISVHVNYDVVKKTMFIQIKNVGRLSQDSTLGQPEFGTGLQLVKSLMPKNNMVLSWQQDDDYVVTTAALSYPIVLLESEEVV